MAINFLNSIDLNKNQLLSLRLENLGTDPAANISVEGQLYYNTQSDVVRVFSDGSWSDVGGSITLTGDVTGGPATGSLATTISAGAVEFTMLDGADVVTSSENFTNASADNNIATSKAIKEYVDLVATGGLVFAGGFNGSNGNMTSGAETGNPLYSGSPATLGFDVAADQFFIVTDADGNFFGLNQVPLKVGDKVISNVAQDAGDSYTASKWTIVENDFDLASLTAVGIGNVNAGSNTTVSYDAGTATVNTKTHNSTITGNGTDTQFTITHSLNTFNSLVEVRSSTSPYGTVYPQVVRPTVNTIRVDFGIAPPAPTSPATSNYSVMISRT